MLVLYWSPQHQGFDPLGFLPIQGFAALSVSPQTGIIPRVAKETVSLKQTRFPEKGR